MRILIYRPGVCNSRSAFEAQAEVYKYLARHCGWEYLIVKDRCDSYASEILPVKVIRWKSIQILKFVSSLIEFLQLFVISIKYKPDIIHTLDPTIYKQGFTGLLVAKFLNKKLTIEVSNTVVADRPASLIKRIKRKILNLSLRHVDGIIATSPKCIERFVCAKLNNNEFFEKVLVLGHPVSEEVFCYNGNDLRGTKRKRVLVVSRLVMEKGLYYIVEGLKIAFSRYKDWEAVIVGTGPLSEKLKVETNLSGLSERIFFAGEVDYLSIPSYLYSSSIFINHAVDFPHWEEFFGIANVEAMACGLPIIVTNSGSIPWVIREPGVACFVEQRNVQQIVTALIKLIEDESFRASMGKRAAEYAARNYGLKVLARKYSSFLESRLRNA